jgi:hypothetical protein
MPTATLTTAIPISTAFPPSAAFQGLRRGAAQADRRPGIARIPPGQDRRPSAASILRSPQIAHHKLDPAVLAKDTTCVDAIDKDGVAISITPSGAWMPPVIAGDTGIPLTQRAQSFLLIPGHPNELAPGKRPRVTLSPTIVVGPGKNLSRSPPRAAISRTRRCCRCSSTRWSTASTRRARWRIRASRASTTSRASTIMR